MARIDPLPGGAKDGEEAMAYVDTMNPNRRLGTVGAVAVLHIAAGYALITGLVATGVITTEPRIIATFTPDKPPPPPSPTPSASPSHTRIAHPTPTPTIAFTPTEPTFTFTPPPPTGGTLGEASFPTGDGSFSPTPRPSFAARTPEPITQPGRWVTPDDYPTTDLRLGHVGVTGLRLTIGEDGRVSQCDVSRSSGWPALDQAACTRLSQRARFKPATDGFGAKVSGSYSTAIRWQIPQ